MRKETKDVMSAFLEGKSCSRHRTRTDGRGVYLHGNLIAWREDNGGVSMCLAGWGSVTTRERLNGLCELLTGKRPWHQKAHEQMFDGREVGTREVITFHTLEVTACAA